MEALSTGEDLSFLSFPVGGTGFSFLRKYLVNDFRSFLLVWMGFPERLQISSMKDRDQDARFLKDRCGKMARISALSMRRST